jgi:hypothetical protein
MKSTLVKLIFWTSLSISAIFTTLSCLPIQIFQTKIALHNANSFDIEVTPIGRVNSHKTTLLPLEYKFPSIANPFNKQINIEANQTITLYYGVDVCRFEGLLISAKNGIYFIETKQSPFKPIDIGRENLNIIANDNLSNLLKEQNSVYFNFIFQIILLLYAPIIGIYFLVKWIKSKRHINREKS